MAAASYGGAAAPVFVEPATATEYPVGAVDLGVVEVPAPLPDVAEHVVQAPCVGLLVSHVVEPLVRIAAVPGDVVERPIPRSGRTGTARVFPFGLRRQPVSVGGCIPLHAVAIGIEVVGGREPVAL